MNGYAGRKRTVKAVIAAASVMIAILAVLLAAQVMAGEDGGIIKGEDGTNTVSPVKIDDSGKYAKELYGKTVGDINDTEAVAELMESMGLEDAAGEYSIRISDRDGQKVLSIDLAEVIPEDQKDVFDSNMELYAQQMLALIPQIGEVEWTYVTDPDDEENGSAAVSLDAEKASKVLGKDVREFGASAKSVKELLTFQNE